MKVLVIGDTSVELSTWVSDNVGLGQLVTNDNFNITLRNQGIFYTSLGDITFDQLKELSLISDRVIFCDQVPWQDQLALDNTYILCNHLSKFLTVENFKSNNPELFVKYPVDRKYNDPTVWTFGCSTTAGIGLVNPEQECYGRLVANHLGMPWQNVAKPGSSTQWSLTHLLHADLLQDDIIIWATTSAERLRRSTTSVYPKDLMLNQAPREVVEFYNDHQIEFAHLDYINTGIRFLKQTDRKFIVLDLLKQSPYHISIRKNLSGYSEWCPTIDLQQDLGTDNIHIGPLGHAKLAKYILDHIQLLNYGVI